MYKLRTEIFYTMYVNFYYWMCINLRKCFPVCKPFQKGTSSIRVIYLSYFYKKIVYNNRAWKDAFSEYITKYVYTRNTFFMETHV